MMRIGALLGAINWADVIASIVIIFLVILANVVKLLIDRDSEISLRTAIIQVSAISVLAILFVLVFRR